MFCEKCKVLIPPSHQCENYSVVEKVDAPPQGKNLIVETLVGDLERGVFVVKVVSVEGEPAPDEESLIVVIVRNLVVEVFKLKDGIAEEVKGAFHALGAVASERYETYKHIIDTRGYITPTTREFLDAISNKDNIKAEALWNMMDDELRTLALVALALETAPSEQQEVV